MTVRVIQGDCLEVMPTLDAESIDAIVSDPPYGLGFMGKAWDHGVPGVPFWVEAIRVAKPGAYLLAFGGTRTFHRLTVAIEDAGWEIRDCLSWLYGSGFPKSLDVSKAIDRAAGAERAVVARGPFASRRPASREVGEGGKPIDWHYGSGDSITAAATDAARQWQGWGTALKPAWEPIILARKPFKQTVAANVQEHGTGALNIDACRILTTPEDIAVQRARTGGEMGGGINNRIYGDGYRRAPGGNASGRWPANVSLDEEAAAMLDEMSGERGAAARATGPTRTGESTSNSRGRFAGENAAAPFYADNGGASRFFYTAKAGRSEREEGLQGLAIRTHGQSNGAKAAIARGEEYQAADNGLNRTKRVANHHPTVKPLDLMRWLVRLVTPPNGVVLDPFMGSGTTGIAAVLESKRFIGIEKEQEYCTIAEKRIAHWGAQGILNLDGVA